MGDVLGGNRARSANIHSIVCHCLPALQGNETEMQTGWTPSFHSQRNDTGDTSVWHFKVSHTVEMGGGLNPRKIAHLKKDKAPLLKKKVHSIFLCFIPLRWLKIWHGCWNLKKSLQLLLVKDKFQTSKNGVNSLHENWSKLGFTLQDGSASLEGGTKMTSSFCMVLNIWTAQFLTGQQGHVIDCKLWDPLGSRGNKIVPAAKPDWTIKKMAKSAKNFCGKGWPKWPFLSILGVCFTSKILPKSPT